MKEKALDDSEIEKSSIGQKTMAIRNSILQIFHKHRQITAFPKQWIAEDFW